MQKATCAHSGADTGTSSGNIEISTVPSRRALLGFAGVGAIALAAPVVALPPTWDAHDWMQRWWAEGCGLEVGGNALNLKGRLNGDRKAIGALMVEIAPAERQTAVIELLEAHNAMWKPAEDPAMKVIRELEAIDAQFISEDVDPKGNEAWLERWSDAFDRLPWAPATTREGRAAKLRYAIEYEGTDVGNRLLQQTLRWLEKLS